MIFQKVREFSTGQPLAAPYWVATADFDGDGNPDVAASDYNAGAVVILLANGDGTFRPGIQIRLAGSIRQIAAADLNHDGYPDLAAACNTPGPPNEINEVVVLMGRGDGTFQTPARIPLPGTVWAVLAADLDRDGITDLAVGQPGQIAIFAGKGDGTFHDPVQLPTPYQEFGANEPVMAIQAADFNGDGKPDLVTVHRVTWAVSLLLSQPGGGYDYKVLRDAMDLGYVHDLCAGDFDRDGKVDLALAVESGTLVLAGNGDGTFRQAGAVRDSSDPLSLGTGDFNGDGIPDLIVGNYYGGKIAVLLGNGDATFREVSPVVSKGDNYSIAVADLNGDGMADFVAANYSSHSLTIALGRGEGTFARARTLASSQSAIAAADLDGDGKTDLVLVNDIADTVDVLSGAASAAASYLVEPNPDSVVVAEWNGNGIPDMIVNGGRRGDGGSWLSSASIMLGGEGGRFQDGGVLDQMHVLAVADLDGDGQADVVALNRNFRAQVFLSRTDGSFEPADELEALTSTPLVVEDFNHDGRLDLAGVSQDAALVFLGRGGGRFQAPVRYTPSDTPITGRSLFMSADFNSDGFPDLAVQGQTSVCIFTGAADGTFAASRCTTTADPPVCPNCVFAVADFDGDGKLDLAMAQTPYPQGGGVPVLTGSVWIFFGMGDATFKPPVKVYTTSANTMIRALVAGDFEGTGETELAATLVDNQNLTPSVAILGQRQPQ